MACAVEKKRGFGASSRFGRMNWSGGGRKVRHSVSAAIEMLECAFAGAEVGDNSEYQALPTPILKSPLDYYAFSIPVGQTLDVSVPIFDDGPGSLNWTVSSSNSSVVSFASSSGTLNAESSGDIQLIIGSSTAASGLYTLTLSSGQEISLYLSIF